MPCDSPAPDSCSSKGRVKYLTGLSAGRTRRLRENWITFAPTHKIFMDCNDRPVISSPTDAIWHRVVCIPFDVVIPDGEIDPDFPSKLEAELSAILAWIVESARNYYRDGLGCRPPEVQASTADYRQSSDRLKEFFEDCCHLNQFAWVSSERLGRQAAEQPHVESDWHWPTPHCRAECRLPAYPGCRIHRFSKHPEGAAGRCATEPGEPGIVEKNRSRGGAEAPTFGL